MEKRYIIQLTEEQIIFNEKALMSKISKAKKEIAYCERRNDTERIAKKKYKLSKYQELLEEFNRVVPIPENYD